MGNLQLVTSLMILAIIENTALPSCTFYRETKDNFLCTSNDIEYELNNDLILKHSNPIYLSLKASSITKINCDAFKSLRLLESLNLSENKLQDLEPCTFQHLSKLKSLNISYNRISTLPSTVFDQSPHIQQLDLKGNKIKTIESELFKNLLELHTLDLSYNALNGKSLDYNIFTNNKQITSLDLSRNDMSAVKDDFLQPLQILQILTLDRCFLSKVPDFATQVNLKSLKTLIFTTNQISRLVDQITFINLDNLEILNLASNAIEIIGENVFKPLRKLKTVVLRNNKLKQIPERTFQNMPKLVNIDLSYNNIEKVKTSYFRNSPMKNLNLSGNRLSYLPENFYDNLISSEGKLKKFLFSNNPWKCACLRNLIEDMKAHDVEYNAGFYNGSVSVCVVDDLHTCKRE